MKMLFTLLTVFIFTGSVADPGGHLSKTIFSNPTDYFRSAATGDWGTLATWQSSPDNSIWSAATLIPTDAANTIYIRSGHTVTISSNEAMDQVVVENGGILFHSANTITVNDGTGDDIIVQNGGIFTLASNSNGPQFSGTATANINTGGMLRLSATGLTNAGAGVHASNYVYQHASVLEYTPNLAFASSGVTFFPNVDAVTIPIFRTTGNLGLIGGIANTVINGLYEANGSITFSNSGTKTFRNGIIGTGNITHDGTSGKFIINGTTAVLGGSGSLTIPATGMDIGSNTTVTLLSNKSVTGNIALLSNALVMMGAFNLTITGDISGGSATSHLVTNGSGKLVLNNITATPRIFPIGGNTTTINPLAISNGSGLNYGARVETGINPAIAVPFSAVNRTWVVSPSGVPAGAVNVNFFYAAGHGNIFFNYTALVEQGFYTGIWNVINTGLTQFGAYQVTTTVSSFAANTDAPMVIGNLGAILSVNNSIQLTVQKQNNRTLLRWTTANARSIDRFTVERAADGNSFAVLAELAVSDLSFTDMQVLPGLNFYRVKMKGRNGSTTYSNLVVILNAAKGFELINVSPNPARPGNCKLNISAAQKLNGEILITDMQGRLIKKQWIELLTGFNQLPVEINSLSKGIYQLYVIAAGERSRVLRFVVE